MKKRDLFLASFLTLSGLFINMLRGQGPIDGFFGKKGSASISLSYTSDNYDSFFVGNQEVDGVPAHNEIDQIIYNLYLKYGLTDNLTVVANLPYIQASGDGMADPVNNTTEQSDFHDVSAFIKWMPHRTQYENGSVSYLLALGGSVPLGYEPNGILSLGSGAPGLDAKLGLQYTSNSGFFGTVITGYGMRGMADNTFGTADGQDFDVPNVVNALIKMGYAGKHFYIDAWLDSQSSLSGVDIMGPGFVGNFPETQVNFSRVGATIYAPLTSFIGISFGGGTIVGGRNIGKGSYYSGALTFNL